MSIACGSTNEQKKALDKKGEIKLDWISALRKTFHHFLPITSFTATQYTLIWNLKIQIWNTFAPICLNWKKSCCFFYPTLLCWGSDLGKSLPNKICRDCLNKPKNRPWLRAYDFFLNFFIISFKHFFLLSFF